MVAADAGALPSTAAGFCATPEEEVAGVPPCTVASSCTAWEALPTTAASPAGAGTSAPARVAPKELTFDTPIENLCPVHKDYVKSTQWTLASSGAAWVLDDESCLRDFKPGPVEPPQFGRRGARTSGAKASTAQPPSSASSDQPYAAALRAQKGTPVAPRHQHLPLAPSRAPLAQSGGPFPKQAKASPSVPVPPGGETQEPTASARSPPPAIDGADDSASAPAAPSALGSLAADAVSLAGEAPAPAPSASPMPLHHR